MSNNQIPDLRSLVDQLGSILTLETLYLEGNPCQLGDEAYRRKVKLCLPWLKQIDATYVVISFRCPLSGFITVSSLLQVNSGAALELSAMCVTLRLSILSPGD